VSPAWATGPADFWRGEGTRLLVSDSRATSAGTGIAFPARLRRLGLAPRKACRDGSIRCTDLQLSLGWRGVFTALFPRGGRGGSQQSAPCCAHEGRLVDESTLNIATKHRREKRAVRAQKTLALPAHGSPWTPPRSGRPGMANVHVMRWGAVARGWFCAALVLLFDAWNIPL